VAFFTLLERHFLSLSQCRFGPKKVSYYGLLQPLLDGLKLCKKEQVLVFNCRPFVFLGVTIMSFLLFLLEFMVIPYIYVFLTFSWRWLFLLVLLGINVYFLIVGGFFSKNKYSYLGGIRSVSASVSYEIIFNIFLLSFILFDKSYSIVLLTNLGFFLLFTIFIICVLVELGRTPFDYMESESELVSGFNTEYSSVSFVLLFLKEYGSLLFFSFLISTVFFYGYFMFTVLIFSLFIIIRSSYPRLRYDKLIGLIWLQLFFFVILVLYCNYYLFLVWGYSLIRTIVCKTISYYP